MEDGVLSSYIVFMAGIEGHSVYSLEKKAEKKAAYGNRGMGVPVKKIVCSDEEAKKIIKASFGTRPVGNLYDSDKKK